MDVPEEEPEEGAPEWLMTFSDLVSLLVTLFIMMLTFTTQEEEDRVKIMSILRGSFGTMATPAKRSFNVSGTAHNQVRRGVAEHDPDVDPNQESKVNALEGYALSEEELSRKGKVLTPAPNEHYLQGDDLKEERKRGEISENDLQVGLFARHKQRGKPAFEPSQIVPAPWLVWEMRRIGRVFAKPAHSKRRFRFEGHCDRGSDHVPCTVADPWHSGREIQIRSFEELSLLRARAVAEIWKRLAKMRFNELRPGEAVDTGLDLRRITISGVGLDRPVVAKGAAENRRVELVVLPLGKEAEDKNPQRAGGR
ncbi:MAG: hypothetical protein CSA62_02450 [Planctomycetota bacterium]|nr:MAG: hypothetical protein CSA62_02450 [Planctomycetota bacterium]